MQLPIHDAVAKFLPTLRIIVGALLTGLLFFGGIVFLLRAQGQFGAGLSLPILDYLSAMLAASGIIASTWLGPVILSRHVQAVVKGEVKGPWGFHIPLETSEQKANAMVQGLASRIIVQAALVEGPAFFALIAYLLNGTLLPLAMALVSFITLLSFFPSQERLEWTLTQAIAQATDTNDFSAYS